MPICILNLSLPRLQQTVVEGGGDCSFHDNVRVLPQVEVWYVKLMFCTVIFHP